MHNDPVNWADEAPPEATCPHLRILRTPEKRPLRGVIVSGRLCGCYTHFFGGITVPCVNAGCPACEQRNGRRWHYYLALFDGPTGEVALWETTAAAGEPLAKLQREIENLRGVTIIAQRVQARANARISVKCDVSTKGRLVLPSEPDVKACLRAIWKLDSTTRYPEKPGWEEVARREHDGVKYDGELNNQIHALPGIQSPGRSRTRNNVHKREA